ncbi:hypothetical protein [Methylobacterium oxalidis]|uniref:hypothetical protein n=1 Tax=Methylobacterium oxalidis TaxID=944322 RepID=UPI0033149C50
MMKHTGAAVLIIAMLSAPAQALVSPQESREQAPNMPASREIVPERVRPTDSDSTGSVRVRRPEKEAPEKDGARKPG